MAEYAAFEGQTAPVREAAREAFEVEVEAPEVQEQAGILASAEVLVH
jgi:hypothetical protein